MRQGLARMFHKLAHANFMKHPGRIKRAIIPERAGPFNV
jgi:hypothetical protein